MNEWKIEALKKNPRAEIIQALREKDLARCLLKTAEIHGHFCPGSALGVMAAAWGMEQLEQWEGGPVSSEGMEDVLAIVEINACFADGVQVVSGCTFGNNALIYRDLGKLAVTFALRGVSKGIRVRVKPEFRAVIDGLAPEFYPYMKKVIMERNGSPEEEAGFKQAGIKAAFALLELPFGELLAWEKVTPLLPEYAPIVESAICRGCKEQVMGTKMALQKGSPGLCRACACDLYYQVDGRGIAPGPEL